MRLKLFPLALAAVLALGLAGCGTKDAAGSSSAPSSSPAGSSASSEADRGGRRFQPEQHLEAPPERHRDHRGGRRRRGAARHPV